MTTIRGTIEKIVAGGYGLLRSPDGVVFCRGVLPGETVEVEDASRSRGVLWALNPVVLEPSSERLDPACPYFPLCGGCDFHHVSYEAELGYKEEIVNETLRRGLRRPVDVISFPFSARALPHLSYRNTVRLRGGKGVLGYCRRKSRAVVDIEDCPIALPAIRAEIGRWAIRKTASSPDSLIVREGNVGEETAVTIAEYGREREIVGEACVMEVRGRRFRVRPESFFQRNTFAAGAIVADLEAALPPGERLLDLFTGVGLFALSLADRFSEVRGFEISTSAVGDFRHNRKGFENVDEITWDAAQGLAGYLQPGDIVLVDPPRAGLPRRLLDVLSRAEIRAVAYISCNPATFARDLGVFFEHGYEPDGGVRLYDMFPRTAHVEMMTILVRGSKKLHHEDTKTTKESPPPAP